MLLNEAKFLGLNFMALRWVLTIVSILIFSAIADRIIKDNDIPNTISNKIKGIHINTSACMGCSVCTQKYPQLFVMSLNKATLIGHCEIDMDKLTCAIESCPVSAISINE